ncbi:Negative elongation factor A [Amphibalanus amphitrite]|uniref:Negative elongation factor A n=1 Tax=Amphibalanus amphitrite TaxID=1232801 RepID=A0A6A4VAP7_AMPAM|nr:Negative elongation factor A [Amphibalanus amphitrite]
MSNVRDSDTSLWLHNKLGTSNDTWINGSICSQLNVSVLRNIRECFVNLQTQVKLKLLLALLHTPRRNLEEWKVDIEEILEIAALDSDQWVSMLAEVMKTFPATGNFNTEIGNVEENRKIFGDLIQELQKLVRKTLDVDLLPLECHYLNRAALAATTGQLPQPEKHFSLRRKPKSAALKLELLQKAQDISAQLKKTVVPSVPVRSRGMPRKMDNSAPLRGIPSRLPSGGFTGTSNLSRLSAAAGAPASRLPRTPAGRKEGRVKMLDINEQPIGFQAQLQQGKNKRKKLPGECPARPAEWHIVPPGHSEDEEQPKEAAPAPAAAGAPASKRQKPAEERVPATPDYAAGLLSANPPTPAPVAAAEPPPQTPQATPTPATNGVSRPTQAAPAAGLVSAQSMYQSQPPAYEPSQPAVQPPQPYQQQQQPEQPGQQVQQHVLVPRVAEYSSQQPVAAQQPQQQQQQQQQQQVAIIAQPQANTQRRGLTLTREQMLEAQEMFRTANKVTRPEKALILGFIAGSRDNPCPHLGNVVTIKLSEDPETLQPSEGAGLVPMVAETHFQMNYSTGEWKRIKKFSRRDGVPT